MAEGTILSTTSVLPTDNPLDDSPKVTDWREGLELPEEIIKDPSLGAIKDIPTLVKSYVHAQKLVGADKIVLPGKDATEADWVNIHRKLGAPEDAAKYEVKAKDGVEISEEFVKTLKEVGVQSGLTSRQLQKVYDTYQDFDLKQEQLRETAKQQKIEQEVSALQKEWGAAFNEKASLAAKVIDLHGDSELKAYLDESGLGNDVKLIKFLAKVGESFKEDSLPNSGGNYSGVMSPDEALKTISEMMADKSGAYFDKNSPAHDSAVKEMMRLYGYAYPNKKA